MFYWKPVYGANSMTAYTVHLCMFGYWQQKQTDALNSSSTSSAAATDDSGANTDVKLFPKAESDSNVCMHVTIVWLVLY